MRIKIAFVQLLPGIDLDENLDIGKKACVEAKEKGADIPKNTVYYQILTFGML